ncbi:hypothetical protein [Streptomyces mirabilis]
MPDVLRHSYAVVPGLREDVARAGQHTTDYAVVVDVLAPDVLARSP